MEIFLSGSIENESGSDQWSTHCRLATHRRLTTRAVYVVAELGDEVVQSAQEINSVDLHFEDIAGLYENRWFARRPREPGTASLVGGASNRPMRAGFAENSF
jgi:hypothetical protein